MANLFEIKDDIDLEDMMQWQEPLLWLFAATVRWCREVGVPCKITSLIRDRQNVKAVSRTHESGRAYDLSIQGWSKTHIHKFCFFMNSNYSDWGAIGKTSGKSIVALYHNNHIHVQIRPNASVDKYLSKE